MERPLRSRSCSVARDIEGESLESERDGANIDVVEPSDNVTISGNQFHEFMTAVMREFGELKDRIKSENSKISDNIKSVPTQLPDDAPSWLHCVLVPLSATVYIRCELHGFAKP